ncbi:hypothetical protein GCM10007352_06350 [Mucilaginibacter phyllosphaerae]|uniref:Uncharacterized protein n=1 Tax=Mucilaginibacter phyllosphaerae TaxID=1812349 RepID=A0ABR6I423_9SPHI|nr:hypothetical protein [Mucilaginibacter phyllosphaerae]GGH03621.1 hypothetical protein GCM10007352_06350 [Mucilaginibacter phyllosphaerae]
MGGFINKSYVQILHDYKHSTTAYNGGKLSLVKKSNLVRITLEEINSIRPSVYKYLLP